MNTGTAESYYTFTRTSWRRRSDGSKEPGFGPKRSHGRNLTYDEAKQQCREWNITHNPGPLRRLMEFTSEANR
jgi:hypothetical protein